MGVYAMNLFSQLDDRRHMLAMGVVVSLIFAPWLRGLVPIALAQDEVGQALDVAETAMGDAADSSVNNSVNNAADPVVEAGVMVGSVGDDRMMGDDVGENAREFEGDAVNEPLLGDTVNEPILMDVTITALRGIVQVRDGDDQPWRKAKAGMVVGIGAEFRTGPRSVVQFRLGRDHEVTLDRLGVIKVLDAVVADGKVKTDVGLKYGRTQYKVAESGIEHDSVIRSPASTLVVRGSDVVIQDQGFVSQVAFLERSPATLTTSGGKSVSVGNGVISGSATSAAATASALTVFSALGNATTGNELNRLATLGGSSLDIGTNTGDGSFSTIIDGSGITRSELVVGGPGVPIQPGEDFPFTTPSGVAVFVFVWQGSTDIDIAVFTPSGNGFSPFPSSFSENENVSRSGSGVLVSNDNTGTSEQQTNQEYVAFTSAPASGSYRAEATLFSGSVTEVQIRAFDNGQELPGTVRGLVEGGSTNLVTTFDVP